MLFSAHKRMSLLRLAYATQFLIALIAIYTLWSQVGGQMHLDLLPWYIKLVLGGGAAFAAVKATAASVSSNSAWNGATVRWLALLLVILIGCGLVAWYAHVWLEPEEDQQGDATLAARVVPARPCYPHPL